MAITGTFHILPVADMDAALAFWIGAMGCTERFRTPAFAEVLAGTSVVCLRRARTPGGRSSLGVDVDDLAAACAAAEAAGGSVARQPGDLAPGVRSATLMDTEGNRFEVTEHAVVAG